MKLGPTWDHYSRNTEIPGPYLKSYLDFCLADVVRDLPMVLDYLLSHLAFSHAFQITLQMQKNGGENKKRDIHHNHRHRQSHCHHHHHHHHHQLTIAHVPKKNAKVQSSSPTQLATPLIYVPITFFSVGFHLTYLS